MVSLVDKNSRSVDSIIPIIVMRSAVNLMVFGMVWIVVV